jgi:hypothetical protein
VLYLAFVCGLMSGSFFPSFSCFQGTCGDMTEMMRYYLRAGPKEALVWAFVSFPSGSFPICCKAGDQRARVGGK